MGRTAMRMAKEISNMVRAAFLPFIFGKLKTMAIPVIPAATPVLARVTPFLKNS